MANLQNIYDARNKLKSDEVQSKIDASQALRSPTATNPVIKSVSPLTKIAKPDQALDALTASARGGAFDLTPRVRTVSGQDTGFTSGYDDKANEQIYGTGNTISQTTPVVPEVNPYDPTTKDESYLSNQFFNRLNQDNISQEELMRITGASDAQTARAMLEGRTGLTKEQQLALNESYEQLKFDKAKTAEEARLMTEEERIRQDVKDMYAPQYTAARDAGQRVQETALRVQGRSAMGSKSEQQQQELIEYQRQVESSIAAEQRIQEQMLLAEARGASSEELDSLSIGLNNAKTKRQEYQDQLELANAGLDQAAIDKSEFNTKTMLDALKAGFEYDPETNSFTAMNGKQKIDQNVSKLLGYASDEFGNQIIGTDGQPLAIEKDNDIEWGSYQDKYGNTVFYDKANPSKTMNPGGTQVYAGSDGFPTSSTTTDMSGIQDLGDGDIYTRDDGTTGNLGENCIKFARENVPNLPFGLYNKKDKQDAINFAVDQGFGGRGGTGAKVGDAILTGEGSVGHAAVIMGVDGDGNFILAEANYRPGQITYGRKIAANDPIIYGYISSTMQPQMSSVINPNAKNEGYNPSIYDQVEIESTQPEVNFTKTQIKEFEYYDDKMELPKSIDNANEEAEFMKNKAIWEKQQEGKYNKDQLSAITELRKEVAGLQEVKDYKVANASINSIIESAGLDSGYGDIAMITSYMRLIDPSTGVKEGEFKNAEEAISKAAQLYNVPKKWAKGTRLTPEGRQALINAAKAQYKSRESIYNDTIGFYKDQAKNYNVKPEDIIGEISPLKEENSADVIDQLRQQLKNPTPQQKTEIANAKKQLLQGERLILRDMKFTAISPEETILSTDIEL